MDAIRIVILGVLVVFAFVGWRSGLVRRVVEFVGLVACVFATLELAPRFAALLDDFGSLSERSALALAGVLIFLAGLVAVRFIAAAVVRVVRISILGWIDRAGGAIFGLLLGALFLSVLMIGSTLVPGGEDLPAAYESHVSTRLVYRAAPTVYELFHRLGGDEQKVWEEVADTARDRLGAAAATTTPRG